MGNEHSEFTQLVYGEFVVMQDGVDLDLEQIRLALSGQHRDHGHPPVPHGQAGTGPDPAE
ncbi:Uncharacterised protein [Mycobacterium tuberculosis]|nr:Uncharacterised protein [Mycobacterium tuberculosis]